MLLNKTTKFFENLKPLIDQTTSSGTFLFELLKKIPLQGIPQDAQTVYPRDGIIRVFILLKLLAIPSVHAAGIGRSGTYLQKLWREKIYLPFMWS